MVREGLSEEIFKLKSTENGEKHVKVIYKKENHGLVAGKSC